jgi:hypothetical protein
MSIKVLCQGYLTDDWTAWQYGPFFAQAIFDQPALLSTAARLPIGAYKLE